MTPTPHDARGLDTRHRVVCFERLLSFGVHMSWLNGHGDTLCDPDDTRCMAARERQMHDARIRDIGYHEGITEYDRHAAHYRLRGVVRDTFLQTFAREAPASNLDGGDGRTSA